MSLSSRARQSANANLIILNGFCAQKPINCTSSLCMSAFRLRFCALLCLLPIMNDSIKKETQASRLEKKWKSKRQQSAERVDSASSLPGHFATQNPFIVLYNTAPCFLEPPLSLFFLLLPDSRKQGKKVERPAMHQSASACLVIVTAKTRCRPVSFRFFRESRPVWQAKRVFAAPRRAHSMIQSNDRCDSRRGRRKHKAQVPLRLTKRNHRNFPALFFFSPRRALHWISISLWRADN